MKILYKYLILLYILLVPLDWQLKLFSENIKRDIYVTNIEYILKIVYNGSPTVPVIKYNNINYLSLFGDGPIMVHDGTRTSTTTNEKEGGTIKFNLNANL